MNEKVIILVKCLVIFDRVLCNIYDGVFVWIVGNIYIFIIIFVYYIKKNIWCKSKLFFLLIVLGSCISWVVKVVNNIFSSGFKMYWVVRFRVIGLGCLIVCLKLLMFKLIFIVNIRNFRVGV